MAWALFSPSLGAAILSPDTLQGWWDDLRQSDSEQAVEKYIDDVQSAAIWAQPPRIYRPSVTYFEQNYHELDPEKVHPFPGIVGQEPVMLGYLATESAGWTGRIILASADVRDAPRLLSPVTKEIGSYQIALVDSHTAGTEVVCRLPFQRTFPYTAGDRVTFTGLVLADGLAEQERGGGLKRVIYMACTSMVRSTNLSLVPRPRRNGKKQPPVLEVNP